MRKSVAILTLASVGLSAPSAHAAPPIVQPVQVGKETVRFDRGSPTVTLKMQRGAIQLRPRPMDHGSVAFDIAVYNNGDAPANFDTVDIEARAGAAVLRPFTLDELEKKAKTRAAWTQVGIALLAGASAAAAASQRDTYRSTLYTPHGVYRGYYRVPSAAGQVAAAGAIAGGTVASLSVEEQLQRTLDQMQDNVVQITTIDPGDSYAGMVVLQKAGRATLPQRVDITLNWNGEVYPFAVQIAKNGTPMPKFSAITDVAEPLDAPVPPPAPATEAAP